MRGLAAWWLGVLVVLDRVVVAVAGLSVFRGGSGRGGAVFGGFCSGWGGSVRFSVQPWLVRASPRLVSRWRLTPAAGVVSHCRLRCSPQWWTRLAFPLVSQVTDRSTGAGSYGRRVGFRLEPSGFVGFSVGHGIHRLLRFSLPWRWCIGLAMGIPVAAIGEAGPGVDGRYGAVPDHPPCCPPASWPVRVGFHVLSRDHTQQAHRVRLVLARFQAPSHPSDVVVAQGQVNRWLRMDKTPGFSDGGYVLQIGFHGKR